MQYAKLGRTDIEVSRFCLGCMGFGEVREGALHTWTLGPDETRTIIGRALDAGINFFDTAMAYSFGTSEEYVGSALRTLAKRDEYVIATKVSARTPQAMEAYPDGKAYVAAMLDASLARLGLDTVDLYYLHSWDYRTPIEDIMEAMNEAVVAGKVRALGISNCHPYQLAKANALAEARGWVRFEVVQSHMNLIFREDERELLQLCAEDQISTVPYSSLASGRLSRRPSETSKRFEQDVRQGQVRRHRRAGCSHHRARGRAGRPIRNEHDRRLAGMAAHEGDEPHRGRHQATPHRRTVSGCGPCALPRGHRLSRGTLRAACACGRDGPEPGISELGHVGEVRPS